MRYRELVEAPISDFEFHGDLDTPGTFRKDDLRKFSDPAWKERVLKLFQKAPYDINLYIINGDENKKVTQRSKYWIDRINTEDFQKYVGIQSKEWAETIVGHPIDTAGKITVLLLQNEGAARVGMTPWMVGHRIAHTFMENNPREVNSKLIGLSQTLASILSSLFTALFRSEKLLPSDVAIDIIGKKILPFRSARTENLNNSGEVLVELMTYYLIHGKIRFLRDWIEGKEFSKQLTPLQEEIFEAAKQFYGWRSLAFEFENFYENQEALDKLFRAMRGSQLRPKTKAALRKEVKIMIDQELWDQYPNDSWTPSEVAHFHLNDAEKKIEKCFKEMLDLAVGKVMVL